ncbi:GNAT family N-acetyltransferase [Flavobacterium sp. RSB2_4_14]|uniref:GNAT family N-acetyltransferase n=1 Tax=Flavobacterium sp. RSB2_4_14 TaxID=3447665 RepID=UPI003F31C19B
MPILKKITSSETFDVRQPVLRKGKPIESCYFEGDDLDTTLHFGVFEDDKILGVISVFDNNNSLFEEKNQAQIRGMAVLENYQGKGFGKKLVVHCEKEMILQNKKLIWFNARVNAVGFYKRMGYTIVGNPFEIKEVGMHYVMCKKLGN